MAKFNFKPLGETAFLKIASERVVFKATGVPRRTKKGFFALPIKIHAGVFSDLEGKKYTKDRGTLLLPGFVEYDEEFMEMLKEGEMIGIVSEKRDGRFYVKKYTVIEDEGDIEEFMDEDWGKEDIEDFFSYGGG